eukprot:scaffold32648_cov63-Phaeocystis_antarctica.AAC.9
MALVVPGPRGYTYPVCGAVKALPSCLSISGSGPTYKRSPRLISVICLHPSPRFRRGCPSTRAVAGSPASAPVAPKGVTAL